MREVLYDDSQLDAFTHDHYPEVHAQFTNGMLRDAKHTCLLSAIGATAARVQRFIARLEQWDAARVSEALGRIAAERREHGRHDGRIDGSGARRPYLAVVGLLVGGSVALGVSLHAGPDAARPTEASSPQGQKVEERSLIFPLLIFIPDIAAAGAPKTPRLKTALERARSAPELVPIEIEFHMSEVGSHFSLLSAGHAGKERRGVGSREVPAPQSGQYSEFKDKLTPGEYLLVCVSGVTGKKYTKSITIHPSTKVNRYVCP